MEESGLSDRLDDVIMLGYGLLGLAVLRLRRAQWMPSLKPAKGPALAGLGLFFVMIAADILTNRRDILGDGDLFTLVGNAEDVIKILAEYLVLFSIYSVYKHPLPAPGVERLPDTSC